MEDLKTIVESLLFVADHPIGVDKLAEVIEEADTKTIRNTLLELLKEYNDPKRGFQLHEVAGGYQFRTHPDCQAYIKRLLKPNPSRLSRAALESLAIIAYKQPIIRSDIEHIRGVDSGGVLRLLMEKKLVRVLGRREIPGRPLIYATTKHFLEVFDLKNLKDLPTPKEIEELTAQAPEMEAPPSGEPELVPPEAMSGPAKGPDHLALAESQLASHETSPTLSNSEIEPGAGMPTDGQQDQQTQPQPHSTQSDDDTPQTRRQPLTEADVNGVRKTERGDDDTDA